MPVVPAAGYDAPTVPGAVEPRTSVPFNYQTQRASPEDFGAQIGLAEQRLGATLEHSSDLIADQAFKRIQLYNQVSSANASKNFIEGANRIVYGDQSDPTAPPGLFSLKGKAGMDATPNARQGILDLYDKTAKSLTNDYQRLQFENETRRTQTIYLNEVGRHYDNQALLFGESTAKAQMALADQGMASHVEDPEAFKTFLTQKVNAAVGLVRQQGGGEEAEKAAEQKARADGVRIAVQELSPKNPTLAADILDKNKDMLPSQEYDALYRMVRNRADEADAFKLAFPSGGGSQAKAGPVSPDQIASAANAAGISGALANTTASIESGHGANTSNKRSPSNTGLFQMAAAGSPGGMNDTTDNQIRVGVTNLAKERADLQSRLGREPTNAEAYLAHQQGAGGAAWLITHPNEPAGNVPGGKGEPPGSVRISENDGDPKAPASQFVSKWAATYNAKEAPFRSGSMTMLTSTLGAKGLVEPGNIDLNARPTVQNPDGTVSTVRSMSFNEDGKEVLIPTVAADGSGILSDKDAIDQYHKTGQFLGKFDTPANATAYAQQLHQQQAGQYSSEPPGLRNELARIQASGASPEVQIKAMNLAREKAQMEWADLQRQETLKKRTSDANAAQYTSKIIGGQVDQQTLSGQVAKDVASGNLTWETGQHLTNMAYEHALRENGTGTKSYGPGFNAAWDRVIAPEGSPEKIVDPNEILRMGGSAGQLTPSGVSQLLNLMESKKTPEGDAQVELLSQMKKAAHQALTGTDPSGTYHDPKGEAQYLKFLQYVLPEIPKLRSQGKSLNEITDLENGPFKNLLKPTSEGGLKRPLTEFMKDLVKATGGAAAPTVPPPGTTFIYDENGNHTSTTPPPGFGGRSVPAPATPAPSTGPGAPLIAR